MNNRVTKMMLSYTAQTTVKVQSSGTAWSCNILTAVIVTSLKYLFDHYCKYVYQASLGPFTVLKTNSYCTFCILFPHKLMNFLAQKNNFMCV